MFRDIHLTTYTWVFENFRLFELPYDSVWTYVFALLFIDMIYYWFHRAAHGKLIKKIKNSFNKLIYKFKIKRGERVLGSTSNAS